MRLTRHRFRFAIGVLICAVGLVLCFAPGILFFRLPDGAAWFLIGGSLCFVPEFNLRFNRDSFLIGVIGLLMVCAGTFITALAVLWLFGYRAHGMSPFYMYIGIGPLFITTGIVGGFDRTNGA
jgi:hypothetical protein